MNAKTRRRILDHISRSDLAQNSSSAIAKRLHINRVTLTKYLTVLQAEGEISMQNVGMAKLWRKSSGILHHHFTDKSNGTLLKGFLEQIGTAVRVLLADGTVAWMNKSFRGMSPREGCPLCLGPRARCEGCPGITSLHSGSPTRVQRTLRAGNRTLYATVLLTPLQGGSLLLQQVLQVSKGEFEAATREGARQSS